MNYNNYKYQQKKEKVAKVRKNKEKAQELELDVILNLYEIEREEETKNNSPEKPPNKKPTWLETVKPNNPIHLSGISQKESPYEQISRLNGGDSTYRIINPWGHNGHLTITKMLSPGEISSIINNWINVHSENSKQYEIVWDGDIPTEVRLKAEISPINELQIKTNNTMSLKQTLQQKFINVDEIAEILEIGIVTNKNVFLYGRGGHAKSEILNEVLSYLDSTGENSFVQACGEGLTEEKLFGGVNLKKFQETGEIEYLVENSFMNKKYVVFEELLDSRMNVLLSLKDILTSKKFRQGSQQFDIKTEFVVCLTNRTKQEVSEDNSVKALLERFPLEYKVEWDKYEADDYASMFNKVLEKPLREVAELCQTINETGDFVSPRTAIHMAQVYTVTGNVNSLRFFGASEEVIEKMEKVKKDQEARIFLEKGEKIILKTIEDYKKLSKPSIEDLKKNSKDLKNIQIEIQSRKYSDKVYSKYADCNKLVVEGLHEIKQKMIEIIEND